MLLRRFIAWGSGAQFQPVDFTDIEDMNMPVWGQHYDRDAVIGKNNLLRMTDVNRTPGQMNVERPKRARFQGILYRSHGHSKRLRCWNPSVNPGPSASIHLRF